MGWLHMHIYNDFYSNIKICSPVKARQMVEDSQPNRINGICASTLSKKQNAKLQLLLLAFSIFFFHHDILSSLSAQCTLGAGNLTLLASNPGSSHANSHSQSLKGALSPVVVVITAQAVDVQGDASGLSKALQAMGDHLGAELA